MFRRFASGVFVVLDVVGTQAFAEERGAMVARNADLWATNDDLDLASALPFAACCISVKKERCLENR
jgi:hypothetical protein